MSTVAQKLVHHSGQFWASTATRSPRSTPAAISALLAEFTPARNSAKGMRPSP